MKKILRLTIIILLISSISLSSYSQISVSKGKAHLIEFTNANADFTVPAGKSWIIYSVFSDYNVDGLIKYDERTKSNYLNEELTIRILLKNFNGIEKTNIDKQIFGPQLFCSAGASAIISYPLILPEKSTFSLVIFKGRLGNTQLHKGSGYISLIEVDN
jgi:hypothetical protein